jgi:hypothetical protein
VSTVTSTERDRIKALMARGLSCNAIARELGRGPATISRHAAAMGLSFDRSATREAVSARVIDLKDRRAAGAVAQAEIAERLQAQVFEPTKMRSIGGRDNVYTEQEIELPLIHDQLELVRAAQVAWTTSMKLTEFSTGESSEAAKSLLSGIAAALSVAAEALPDGD